MPPDSEFMMTAEEIRLKRSKRRRMIVLLVAAALLLVIGYFTTRPALSAIKAWQARRHAAKAFAYIDHANWLEARKEASAAYQLRQTEPQSVRAIARFLSRTRQPDALEFWQQLEKLTPLTREDRQDEAAIAIMTGEISRAEIAVQALLESEGADPVGWLLAAQLAIQKGAADDAMSALTKIFNAADATEEQQLQAALLELALASGSEAIDERATDAWSRIEKISRGKSATALDALVLLARQSMTQSPNSVRLIATTSDEIRRALENHPLSKAPQKLIALDLVEHGDVRAGLADSRRDELIARGIQQFKDGDPSDLLTLAIWLNSKREFEKTLEAIPLEKALLGRDLFLQYLDALGGLERWGEIKQLLEGDRYPLDPVVQHMYLARCSAQLDEKAESENNWQRALNDAALQNDEGYTRLLLFGSNAAENRGQKTEDSGQRSAVSGRRSDSGEPITDNQELITLSALAEKLVERNPRSLPHRTFLALARLKQNRASDALAVYDNITVARGALTPSALAVHAAVLAANGKMDNAKSEAEQSKPEQLLVEERQLIQNLL